ncbi:MAG: hypothetical protein ED559_02225 [Phycisphaera sp.]|nr:MAG: hypothetical protein ED559_02225 [Phycisphaera sp.]
MDSNTLEQVNQIVAAIQEHPLWGHAGLIALLVTGVLLWVSGRRVLKPSFAVIGALAGGFLGQAVVPGLGIDSMFGLSGEIAGAAVGGTLGALAAILIFRVAVGVLSASVVGGLALLGASVFIQTSDLPADEAARDSESALVEPENSLDEDSSSWKDELREDIEQGAIDIASGEKEASKFVSDLFYGFKAEFWDPLDGGDQMLLTSSGLAGFVAGLALGVFAPKKTTALVTAFAGAGMWLPALYFLSQTLDLPGKALLERVPIEWLAIWLVVSMTGLLIQWQGLTDRRKDKKSKRDRDDDDDDKGDDEDE